VRPLRLRSLHRSTPVTRARHADARWSPRAPGIEHLMCVHTWFATSSATSARWVPPVCPSG
jgi:hypothetical protein